VGEGEKRRATGSGGEKKVRENKEKASNSGKKKKRYQGPAQEKGNKKRGKKGKTGGTNNVCMGDGKDVRGNNGKKNTILGVKNNAGRVEKTGHREGERIGGEGGPQERGRGAKNKDREKMEVHVAGKSGSELPV